MPTGEAVPPPPWIALLVSVGLAFAVAAPGASLGDPPAGVQVVGEVGVVLLLAAAGWRRIAATAWLGLFVFQLVRLISTMAMGEEGLLVDLLWLLRHTWVLLRDVIGGWSWPLLAAVLAGILACGGLAAELLRAASAHPRSLGGAGVALLVATMLPPVPGSWITPVLVANLRDSAALWAADAALVAEAMDHPTPRVAPDDAPDVHIYVIESYGAVLLRNEDLAVRYLADLAALETRLVEAGWTVASGMSTAPVSGGRSWIADAAVLLGTPVAHETSYRHLMERVDTLPHLPAWFAAAGYRTVLCRPKDRARPGVQLENPLGFERTVFFDDLAYEGPRLGWGWVPDQYSLGWLREEVFPEDTGPTFAFTHLVTAHIPWREPPAVVADWRALGEGDDDASGFEDRDALDELGFHLHRFRRGERGLGADLRGYLREGDAAESYRAAIAYDLDVLTGHAEALESDRPALVVWMGDHAPPGIASRQSFAVPVHVMATDPSLLQPFLDLGFRPGLRPGDSPVLGHHELYEPLVEVVPEESR